MATTHNSFTVGTTATKIIPETSSGRDITIQNNGSGIVFIGGKDITSSTFGFKLVSGAAFSVELDGQDAIWAISASGSNNVSTLIVNLERTK
jgi:hypothetical protein